MSFRKTTADNLILNGIGYIFIIFISAACLFPFIILLSGSFTSENAIINYGFSIIPRDFTLAAYTFIFRNPTRVGNAYGVSIFITVFGTLTALFISSLGAYVMYRKDVKYRNVLAFFLYFTTLFNGGLASYYIIIVRYFQLKNTLSILLLSPMLANVIYILIIRNFFTSTIPNELVESSRIDGTNDFQIYYHIILPISKPVLASIGLFIALGYWNDWWTAMMFVERDKLQPLQYVLYSILSNSRMDVSIPAAINMPRESLKLAMTIISIGPIVLLYPLLQKYFVKGITLGSVKG